MDFQNIENFVTTLNGLFFHEWVIYALLFTGVVFTIWSGFGQYRALTHGVSVIRGKYDDPDDPGAISHFQALSAALSATVGLGNIAGVALAVALGGPGAIFWMWIIGFLGMSLKMTEVAQSMLYRDTSDPSNPHGGPMFVVKNLLSKQGGNLGVTLGGLFCLTLILSAITGGNMFQAWNVADVTTRYFDIPGVSGMEKTAMFDPETFAIGIFLAIVVGLVIIGGVKRIGSVAGKLVPFMCGIYIAAGLLVLLMNIGHIPSIIMLIIQDGLGLGSSDATGAFMGGSFGFAMSKGIQRALFSSEAGQGSSPIAHSAAKCDEPIRESVVAGIEPFIDTIVVCTITALVILTTGAWNRDAEAVFADDAQISISMIQTDNGPAWEVDTPMLPKKNDEAVRITQIHEGDAHWSNGDNLFMIIDAEPSATTGTNYHKLSGIVYPVKSEGGDEIIGYDVNWSLHPAVPQTHAEDGQESTPVVDQQGQTVYQPVTLKDRG
ncbi:MAG: alanine/glycine:cation symporter family protein, partial [Phycisphaerales bacterium]